MQLYLADLKVTPSSSAAKNGGGGGWRGWAKGVGMAVIWGVGGVNSGDNEVVRVS